MIEPPRSEEFDDVYFSAHNGLEETHHVFIKGNGLPHFWQGKEAFTVLETGFGTGLNFFATWKLFEETAEPNQTLDFISIEKFPVTIEFIQKALSPWDEELGSYIKKFSALYPIRSSGFHRIKLSEQVTLTLIFDDINDALPNIHSKVDCWYLDGFTPAKNPEMWTDTLYSAMARLSHTEARVATFTAAADVKRGLEEAGFNVEKTKGFRYKRNMFTGHFEGREASLKQHKLKIPKALSNTAKGRIAIIGGGLAGTGCAYTLKQYGFTPVIFESGNTLAAGSSGNSLGLYNPRFSKLRDNLSDFYAPAYAQFIRTAKLLTQEIDYNPCGTLHLINNENKAERFTSMAKTWGWHEDHVELVNKAKASEIAGIPMDCDAVYLPDSGSVSPNKLCHYYAQDIEVKLNTKINNDSLQELQRDYDAVIFANSISATKFEELSWLTTDIIKGQTTYIKTTNKSAALNCNVCYSGHISANQNGYHLIGSTFDKGIEDREVIDLDHQNNLDKLYEHIPSLASEKFEAYSGWAGIRLATRDRFPVIGPVPNTNNMFVSTAFGSHGLVGSIAGAHLLADYLRGQTLSLAIDTAYELSPQRFIDRASKKGRILI